MLKFLAKLFIKTPREYDDPATRRAYGVLCGAIGILLNILLFAGKFIAGSLAKSVAVTADAFNNLADAGSSVITMIGFRLAGQKPDKEHPFGHGRFEYIAGLLVSAAIILMGVELLKTSVEKIIAPQAVEFSVLTAVILVFRCRENLYGGLQRFSRQKTCIARTRRNGKGFTFRQHCNGSCTRFIGGRTLPQN